MQVEVRSGEHQRLLPNRSVRGRRPGCDADRSATSEPTAACRDERGARASLRRSTSSMSALGVHVSAIPKMVRRGDLTPRSGSSCSTCCSRWASTRLSGCAHVWPSQEDTIEVSRRPVRGGVPLADRPYLGTDDRPLDAEQAEALLAPSVVDVAHVRHPLRSSGESTCQEIFRGDPARTTLRATHSGMHQE